MIECTYGVTGDRRHELFTPADYSVKRKTATATDYDCRQCLLTLLATVDGEEVTSVTLIRPADLNYDRQRHHHVLFLLEQRKLDAERRDSMRRV